jgi:hypothetical protein
MKNDRNDIQGFAENADSPDVFCRENPERCDPDPPMDHRRHRRL